MSDLVGRSLPAQQWGPIGAGNTVTRRFDLSLWFRNGDTPAPNVVPVLAVIAPVNDTTPLTLGDATWETESRLVRIAPGLDYQSPGPRITVPITGGGTRGVTYEIQATFQDSGGQTRTVVGYQFVQYDATA
jgi:hypothetical protein